MQIDAIFAILVVVLLSANQPSLFHREKGVDLLITRSLKSSLSVGITTTIGLIFAALIDYPINKFLLANSSYLQTMVYVIVCIIIALALYLYSFLYKGKADSKLDPTDFFICAINIIVLGLCFDRSGEELGKTVLTMLQVGASVVLLLVLYVSLRDKVKYKSAPHAFRGLPLSLLIAAIMALAIYAIM